MGIPFRLLLSMRFEIGGDSRSGTAAMSSSVWAFSFPLWSHPVARYAPSTLRKVWRDMGHELTIELKPSLWRTCRVVANRRRLQLLHSLLHKGPQTVGALAVRRAA